MSKTDYNQHLINALPEQLTSNHKTYVDVSDQTISFQIQRGPIAEEGHNGCDATDMIIYLIGLYRSFNNAIPCRENSITITKLEEALHWQNARTADRNERSVEGTSAA